MAWVRTACQRPVLFLPLLAARTATVSLSGRTSSLQPLPLNSPLRLSRLKDCTRTLRHHRQILRRLRPTPQLREDHERECRVERARKRSQLPPPLRTNRHLCLMRSLLLSLCRLLSTCIAKAHNRHTSCRRCSRLFQPRLATICRQSTSSKTVTTNSTRVARANNRITRAATSTSLSSSS